MVRHIGQTINVGTDIVIRVNKIERRPDGSLRVALGFDAPHEVPIWRSEILAEMGLLDEDGFVKQGAVLPRSLA